MCAESEEIDGFYDRDGEGDEEEEEEGDEEEERGEHGLAWLERCNKILIYDVERHGSRSDPKNKRALHGV